jgi:hypothetical protein
MNEDLVEEQNLPQPAKDQCPKCGSLDIRRSNSQGVVAAVNLMFGRKPFRCRSCRCRFYRSGPSDPNDD